MRRHGKTGRITSLACATPVPVSFFRSRLALEISEKNKKITIGKERLWKTKRMFKIKLENLHWLSEEQEFDLCAHGKLKFEFFNEIVFETNNDAVSLNAAVIFLLRTIFVDHSKKNSKWLYMMPCCAHLVFESKENLKEVAFVHCCDGEDFEVIHSDETVCLNFPNRTSIKVPIIMYAKEVLRLAKLVEDFYQDFEKKKIEPKDEEVEKGYKRFVSEWHFRVKEAKDLIFSKEKF